MQWFFRVIKTHLSAFYGYIYFLLTYQTKIVFDVGESNNKNHTQININENSSCIVNNSLYYTRQRRYTIITGTTGHGKTNVFYELLQPLMKKMNLKTGETFISFPNMDPVVKVKFKLAR